jgi:hypothetical protein
MSEDKDLYGAMMYKLCMEVGNWEGANRFRQNYNDYWTKQRAEDARRQQEIRLAQANDKQSIVEKNEREKQEELQRQETMWSKVSAEQMKRDEEEPQVQGGPPSSRLLSGLGRLFGSGRKHKSPRRKNKTRKSRKARRLYKSRKRRR